LKRLRRPEEVAQARGLALWRVLPYRRPPEVEEEVPEAEPPVVAEQPDSLDNPSSGEEETGGEAEQETGGEA
jgi:hypothetical protein